MCRSSDDSNTSRNNIVPTTSPAAIATPTQPSAPVHRNFWSHFVDSFKPPEGSNSLNNVDPSQDMEKRWRTELVSGAGLEGVSDGDGSHKPERLKRDLRGRHLQVSFCFPL